MCAAQASSRKGSAKSWDHCALIHEIWTHALLNQTYIWIERVASEYNISDLPSRMNYELVREMGAVWKAPLVAMQYLPAVGPQ